MCSNEDEIKDKICVISWSKEFLVVYGPWLRLEVSESFGTSSNRLFANC